jgi:hypothetical protein
VAVQRAGLDEHVQGRRQAGQRAGEVVGAGDRPGLGLDVAAHGRVERLFTGCFPGRPQSAR